VIPVLLAEAIRPEEEERCFRLAKDPSASLADRIEAVEQLDRSSPKIDSIISLAEQVLPLPAGENLSGDREQFDRLRIRILRLTGKVPSEQTLALYPVFKDLLLDARSDIPIVVQTIHTLTQMDLSGKSGRAFVRTMSTSIPFEKLDDDDCCSIAEDFGHIGYNARDLLGSLNLMLEAQRFPPVHLAVGQAIVVICKSIAVRADSISTIELWRYRAEFMRAHHALQQNGANALLMLAVELKEPREMVDGELLHRAQGAIGQFTFFPIVKWVIVIETYLLLLAMLRRWRPQWLEVVDDLLCRWIVDFPRLEFLNLAPSAVRLLIHAFLLFPERGRQRQSHTLSPQGKGPNPTPRSEKHHTTMQDMEEDIP